MQRLGAPPAGTRARRRRLQAGRLSRASAAANPARRASGGAGRARRSSRGPAKSGPSGFPAAFAALSAAPCRACDAASGFGRPAGDRTAAQGAEGGAVGGHRAARPQGGRLAGGLLQRLVGACRPRGYGTARDRAASPASRASAGGPSKGWRIQKGWESVSVVGIRSPCSLTALLAPAAGSRAEGVPSGAGGSSRPRR